METCRTNKKLGRMPEAIFFLSFAVFAFLFYCAPLVSDDLYFAGLPLSGPLEMMQYSLGYGNGRLLGNFFAILLTKNMLLRVVIKALSVSAIIVLLPKVLCLASKLSYLASFVLFISMKLSLFAQVFSWTSGFTNYALPAAILLLNLLLLSRYDKQAKGWRIPCLVLLGLGSVAAQLFVEHSSIVHLFLAAGLFIYALKKRRESLLPAGVYLFGTLLGGAAMLLIPMLFARPGNLVEGYRRIQAFSELPQTIVSHGIGFSNFLISYLPLVLLLCVSIMLLPCRCTVKKFAAADRFSTAGLAAFCACACFIWINPNLV